MGFFMLIHFNCTLYIVHWCPYKTPSEVLSLLSASANNTCRSVQLVMAFFSFINSMHVPYSTLYPNSRHISLHALCIMLNMALPTFNMYSLMAVTTLHSATMCLPATVFASNTYQLILHQNLSASLHNQHAEYNSHSIVYTYVYISDNESSIHLNNKQHNMHQMLS